MAFPAEGEKGQLVSKQGSMRASGHRNIFSRVGFDSFVKGGFDCGPTQAFSHAEKQDESHRANSITQHVSREGQALSA